MKEITPIQTITPIQITLEILKKNLFIQNWKILCLIINLQKRENFINTRFLK